MDKDSGNFSRLSVRKVDLPKATVVYDGDEIVLALIKKSINNSKENPFGMVTTAIQIQIHKEFEKEIDCVATRFNIKKREKALIHLCQKAGIV